MKIDAIVYQSNTGHTKQYAALLSKEINIPYYSIEESLTTLQKGSSIIYLGWIHAKNIIGYKKANKKYQIKAICAVGLCDTNSLVREVREKNNIEESIPLFTLQGGIKKDELKGMNRFILNLLIKALEKDDDISPEDQRALCLLKTDANYVKKENLSLFLTWFKEN